MHSTQIKENTTHYTPFDIITYKDSKCEVYVPYYKHCVAYFDTGCFTGGEAEAAMVYTISAGVALVGLLARTFRRSSTKKPTLDSLKGLFLMSRSLGFLLLRVAMRSSSAPMPKAGSTSVDVDLEEGSRWTKRNMEIRAGNAWNRIKSAAANQFKARARGSLASSGDNDKQVAKIFEQIGKKNVSSH